MTSTTLTYSKLRLDQAARIAQIVADELSRDAGSSNGRTAGFESVDAGSTPAPASNSEQDGSAIAAVTSMAQLANAVGVEPLPSSQTARKPAGDLAADNGDKGRGHPAGGADQSKPGPLNPEAADGQPSIPSDDTAGAKSDGLQSVVDRVGQEPGGIHCQSSHAVTNPPERKRPSFRPHCQNPNLCASGTRDHCWSCSKAMAQSEAA